MDRTMSLRELALLEERFWVLRQDNYGTWVVQAGHLIRWPPFVRDQFAYTLDYNEAIDIAVAMNTATNYGRRVYDSSGREFGR